MSGPKHAKYEVVSNAEVRRRAREEARLVAEEVKRRVAAVAAAVARAGDQGSDTEPALAFDVAVIDLDTASRSELEAWSASTAARAQAIEDELSARSTRARFEQMVQAVAGPATPGAGDKPAASEPAARTDPRPVPAEPWRERAVAGVRAALARVAPGTAEAEREEIERVAGVALAAGSESEARLLTDELKLRVQQAADAAARRRRAAQETASLFASLNGLEGEQVEEARKAVRAAEAEGQVTAAVREQVRQAEVTARREADRRYTAGVLSSALSDLGYEVEEGFATLSAGERGAHAARWPAHAVKVRFAADGEIALRVVREEHDGGASDEQMREDQEIEHEFCRDFSRVAARLEAAHIRVRITSQVMPGEAPVEVVDHLRARRSHAGRHQQAAAHARPVPRERGT